MNFKLLRLNLADCIHSKSYYDIIKFIEIIKRNPETNNFKILFWYDCNNLNDDEILNFSKKMKSLFNDDEIEIQSLQREVPVWYDILNSSNETNFSHHKFKSIYSNNDDILRCLAEFSNVLKFENKKSSYNKNGYNKNAKDRYDWFKKLGKQN